MTDVIDLINAKDYNKLVRYCELSEIQVNESFNHLVNNQLTAICQFRARSILVLCLNMYTQFI